MLVLHACEIAEDARDGRPGQCDEQEGRGAAHTRQSTTLRNRSAFPLTASCSSQRGLTLRITRGANRLWAAAGCMPGSTPHKRRYFVVHAFGPPMATRRSRNRPNSTGKPMYKWTVFT
jgi:hypothetical protein